jgi:hypothetical protein
MDSLKGNIMYVLIYTDSSNQPRYVQGTLAEINAHVHQEWVNGDIDQDEWDYVPPFEMLCIEDGRLTQVNSWEMTRVPQFTVT